jgi:hypothetical protein
LAAHRWTQWRSRASKRDAEDEGAHYRYPQQNRLFLGRWRPQQRAIAATHQREAALNQANGPIAQIVGSPVAFGNASGAEQNFRDFPVGAALHPRIKRSQGEREPPAAALRERMQRRPRRPAVKSSPQAPACIRAEFKVTIEREFDGITAGNDWRFFEPNAMFYLLQTQYGVPAVRALPQLTVGQAVEIQGNTRLWDRERYRPHRNDRRQNFRRPEDRLFEAGMAGVSCENTNPSADGIPGLAWEAPSKHYDSHLQNRDYDGDIPTLTR